VKIREFGRASLANEYASVQIAGHEERREITSQRFAGFSSASFSPNFTYGDNRAVFY